MRIKALERYNKLKPLIVLGLCLGFPTLIGCNGHKSNTQTATEMYSQQIVGKWQADEINQGVTCVVTFHEDKRMDQYFRHENGHDKLRPGRWEFLGGDTILVEDQTGPTKLTIETLNDSVMILHTLDSFPVFFHKVKDKQ